MANGHGGARRGAGRPMGRRNLRPHGTILAVERAEEGLIPGFPAVGPVADPVGPILPRAPVAPVGPVDVDVHPARVRSPMSDVLVTVIEPSEPAV